MDPKQPIPRQEDRSDEIVGGQWGGDGPRSSGHRRSVTQFLRNRGLPLVLAGLGAVAGLASLTQTWVVRHFPPISPDGGTLQIRETVDRTGGLGLVYLVGILGLAVAVALTLHGTGATRPNARIAGLALAAALLAVLVAGMTTIDNQDGIAAGYFPGQEGFVEHERGMVAALLTCALLGAAVLLAPAAGRSEPEAGAARPEDGAAALEDGAATPGAGAAALEARRPRPRRAAADDLPPPADLTVRPTAPFVRPD